MNQQAVYVYIKQDYAYRGLHEVAQGQITIQQLIDVAEEKEGAMEAVQAALQATDHIQYSFMLNMNESIALLRKDGVWGGMDEVGYIAFSLNSVEEARKEVADMFLGEELTG